MDIGGRGHGYCFQRAGNIIATENHKSNQLFESRSEYLTRSSVKTRNYNPSSKKRIVMET